MKTTNNKKQIIIITISALLLFVVTGLVVFLVITKNHQKSTVDSNGQETSFGQAGRLLGDNLTLQIPKDLGISRQPTSPAPETPAQNPSPAPSPTQSPFFKDGIMIVNKKHPLPEGYNPGENAEAVAQLNSLITTARNSGIDLIFSWSGFRSYSYQANLFNSYVARSGVAEAETYSARPGYSEHQTGLAFDLISSSGNLYRVDDQNYDYNTDWVAQNAHRFGFIIRYRDEWQGITGYLGEPWHLRYLGVDLASHVFASNLPLENYLGVEGGDYIR